MSIVPSCRLFKDFLSGFLEIFAFKGVHSIYSANGMYYILQFEWDISTVGFFAKVFIQDLGCTAPKAAFHLWKVKQFGHVWKCICNTHLSGRTLLLSKNTILVFFKSLSMPSVIFKKSLVNLDRIEPFHIIINLSRIIVIFN